MSRCPSNTAEKEATLQPSARNDFSPNLRVQKVRVGHGGMIDSVQFVLTDGMNLYELPKLGGNGGTHAE